MVWTGFPIVMSNQSFRIVTDLSGWAHAMGWTVMTAFRCRYILASMRFRGMAIRWSPHYMKTTGANFGWERTTESIFRTYRPESSPFLMQRLTRANKSAGNGWKIFCPILPAIYGWTYPIWEYTVITFPRRSYSATYFFPAAIRARISRSRSASTRRERYGWEPTEQVFSVIVPHKILSKLVQRRHWRMISSSHSVIMEMNWLSEYTRRNWNDLIRRQAKSVSSLHRRYTVR